MGNLASLSFLPQVDLTSQNDASPCGGVSSKYLEDYGPVPAVIFPSGQPITYDMSKSQGSDWQKLNSEVPFNVPNYQMQDANAFSANPGYPMQGTQVPFNKENLISDFNQALPLGSLPMHDPIYGVHHAKPPAWPHSPNNAFAPSPLYSYADPWYDFLTRPHPEVRHHDPADPHHHRNNSKNLLKRLHEEHVKMIKNLHETITMKRREDEELEKLTSELVRTTKKDNKEQRPLQATENHVTLVEGTKKCLPLCPDIKEGKPYGNVLLDLERKNLFLSLENRILYEMVVKSKLTSFKGQNTQKENETSSPVVEKCQKICIESPSNEDTTRDPPCPQQQNIPPPLPCPNEPPPMTIVEMPPPREVEGTGSPTPELAKQSPCAGAYYEFSPTAKTLVMKPPPSQECLSFPADGSPLLVKTGRRMAVIQSRKQLERIARGSPFYVRNDAMCLTPSCSSLVTEVTNLSSLLRDRRVCNEESNQGGTKRRSWMTKLRRRSKKSS